MPTIAQISDLHFRTAAGGADHTRNGERLRQVLAAIEALRPQPEAILVTGDLVDLGEPEEYALLAEALRAVRIPLHFLMGNHDARAPFFAAFPHVRASDGGFLQSAVEIGGLRVVTCDTLEPGRQGGGFCEARAAWLARTLDAAPHAPTLVALHHPPVASGVRWMDPAPDEPWIGRLHDVLDGREQVVGLVAGHLHRAFFTTFAGKPLAAAPAVSVQLTLDLTPVDLHRPDGREIVVEEPPGFLLHLWEDGRLTSHVALAGAYPPVAHYTRPFAWAGT